jgi:type II secretory pathway component PulL
MKKKIVGLDIRYDCICAVEIKKGIKGYIVESFCNVPVTSQENIEQSIQSGIQEILKKIDITNAVCVASFPDDHISYRNIQVPFKDHQKIRQILPYELEPSLAYASDNVTIDFKPIQLFEHQGRTDLLTAVAENTRLKSYLDLLAQVNINPKIVAPGAYPLILYLTSFFSGNDHRLYMDIDTRTCTLFAVAGKDICAIRSFFLHPDASIAVETMCRNIKHTISALTDTLYPNFNPDKIFLAGCRTNIPQINKEIELFLNIPVETAAIKHDALTFSDDYKSGKWDPLIMNNALALVLNEIKGIDGLNFRTGLFDSKEQWHVNKKRLIKTGIIAGIVIMFAMLNIFTEMFQLKKKITAMDLKIHSLFSTTFPNIKKIVDPLHQFTVELNEEKKTTLFSATAFNNIKVVDILLELSNRIPKEKDVVFSRFSKLTNNITISGDTDTFNSVDEIKNLLEEADIFEKVTISSATIDKSDNRVRFKLTIQI